MAETTFQPYLLLVLKQDKTTQPAVSNGLAISQQRVGIKHLTLKSISMPPSSSIFSSSTAEDFVNLPTQLLLSLAEYSSSELESIFRLRLFVDSPFSNLVLFVMILLSLKNVKKFSFKFFRKLKNIFNAVFFHTSEKKPY